MAYVEHPLIKQGVLERREYQLELSRICKEEDVLIVIPTGLGKTVIALLVIADHIKENPQEKCIFLAPTRPLVHQHHGFLLSHLNLDEDKIAYVTGEERVEARKERWDKMVICATPQVALSDIERGFISLKEVGLMIYDEAHRAVGNHPYSQIGSLYTHINPYGRKLGLTASLPSDEACVNEILQNLSLKRIELRDEKSEDVRPYVQRTDIEWVELKLSPAIERVREKIKEAMKNRMELLNQAGVTKIKRLDELRLKKLLELRKDVERTGDRQLKHNLYSLIRLTHALQLLETQGLSCFTQFLERLQKRSRALGVKDILQDPNVKEAYEAAKGLISLDVEHPKLNELVKLLKNMRREERAIVFTSYRDSVKNIHKKLLSSGLKVGCLIGKRGEGGQSQKEQIEALNRLRKGDFNVLLATQVGEEGLDVSECSLVIFYDSVPSAIRFVQRKGRTGRRSPGKVVGFITKGTRDEAYYWMVRRRLREVRRAAKLTRGEQKGPLDRFISPSEDLPQLYVDSRESSSLVELLKKKGAEVQVRTLEVGDVVASSDVVIERKTLDDFLKSIIDGRLFKQLVAMKEAYLKPVLIIQEGEHRSSILSDAAYYGALASIVSDFQIPVFIARGEEDVAELIYHIARREQLEKKREVRIRDEKKPLDLSEVQKYVVAGVPGVSTVLAERLLKKFGSVERVFTASEKDLKMVDGIGEKLAKRIREIASYEYKSA